ncbi:MAG: hypothetical protein LH654_06350, partial [Thermoleophilia bacterium]|nr:hypothetical protein [Thermoleophilia bacterium]
MRAIARPSLAHQAAFVATAGLATFARAQYAALYLAAILAAVVVERGRMQALVSRYSLLVGVPILAAVAIVSTGRLGRYGSVASFDFASGAIEWLPRSAFALALAVGAVMVPGAVAWTLHELATPRNRTAHGIAALITGRMGAQLAASALHSSETAS